MVVRKRGRYWVVLHCHGRKRGRIIGRHRTRKAALRQHRAIMASKARRKKRKHKRR